jgi:hypothetical protein
MTSYTYDIGTYGTYKNYRYLVLQYVSLTNELGEPFLISCGAGASSVNITGFMPRYPKYNTSVAGYDEVLFKVIDDSAQSTFKEFGADLWYYYTNTKLADSATPVDFYTGYYAATHKSVFGINATIAGQSDDIKITLLYSTNTSDDYINVMLVSRDGSNTSYKPVVIERLKPVTGNGFASTPSIKQKDNGYDLLTFQTSASGKIYYYYATTSTAPSTPAAYLAEYYKLDDLGDELLNVDTTPTNRQLAPSNLAEDKYTTVVLMLETDTVQYKPILVPRYIVDSSSNGGYSVAPKITAGAATDVIKCTPANTSARLHWYYTNETTTPANATAFFNKASEVGTPSGSSNTYNETLGQYTITHHGLAGYYANVVLMLVTDTTSYKPIMISRYNHKSSNNGFSSAIYTGNNPSYSNRFTKGTPDTIVDAAFATGVNPNAKVMYYYTTSSASVSNVATFMAGYNDAVNTLKGIKDIVGGTVTLSSIPESKTYYIRIMVIDGYDCYKIHSVTRNVN